MFVVLVLVTGNIEGGAMDSMGEETDEEDIGIFLFFILKS